MNRRLDMLLALALAAGASCLGAPSVLAQEEEREPNQRVEPDFHHGVHKDLFSSSEGQIRVFVVKDKHVVALFEYESAAKCPHGGTRRLYFKGQFTRASVDLINRSFQGTIMLCTQPKELIDECGLDSVWQTKVTGEFIDPYRIKLQYQGEHYPRDDDGELICQPKYYKKEVLLKRPGLLGDTIKNQFEKAEHEYRKTKRDIDEAKEEVDEGVEELNRLRKSFFKRLADKLWNTL